MNLVKIFVPDEKKKWVPVTGYVIGHTDDHQALFLPAAVADHQQIGPIQDGKTILTIQGVLVLDKTSGIYECSGFLDRNGGYIYDQDIIIVESKCFLISKSLTRTRWEVVALSPQMEPIDKPVALYKVAPSLEKKATVFGHNQYRVGQRSNY